MWNMANTRSILIINRTFPPSFGATGRMACDLALHLRHQGHKVTILTTAEIEKIDHAKNLDVIRIGTPQKPRGIFDYLKILWAIYRKTKKLPNHDIVISMTDPPLQAIIGDKIAKKMNAKHIHWAMDLYPDLLPTLGTKIHPFIFNIIKSKIYTVYKKTDALVTISKCMARYLTHHGVARTNMHVIENWPDKYLREDNDEPAQSLLDDEKFRILYAGTIGLAHDFDTVLKSAKYLQKHAPNIEFIFTNRGGAKDALASKIKKHGLRNIQLISPQPSKKLSSLMASGDLHLITMKKGAIGKLFPSKFYSALAAGRPSLFIGPNTCNLHNKIIDSNIGLSVSNGDAKSLTQGILKYYNDGDMWFTHCANAKKIMGNHNPLDQWTNLINSL